MKEVLFKFVCLTIECCYTFGSEMNTQEFMDKDKTGHSERGFITAADGAEATRLTPEQEHEFEGIAEWLARSARSPKDPCAVPPTHFPEDTGVIRGL